MLIATRDGDLVLCAVCGDPDIEYSISPPPASDHGRLQSYRIKDRSCVLVCAGCFEWCANRPVMH